VAAEVDSSRLQETLCKAENGAVRYAARISVLAIAALCGCLIAIPQTDGPTAKNGAAARTVPAPEARVDINHASLDELLKVPGMMRSWAGRIVRFRPYRTKQDLLDRGVVSSSVYDRIKDYIIAHRDKE
jgi:competence protein ComEA